MNCCVCGKPEKITNFGGFRLSVCADCSNKETDLVPKSRNVRTPRTKSELQAHWCELCATIEREVVEPPDDYKELRSAIVALKQNIRDRGMKVPDFDDWTMQIWSDWRP